MAEIAIILALGLVALAAIAYPFLAAHERYPDRASLDADLRRYREALRDDTVCGRCRGANPAGSRFCAECGRPCNHERLDVDVDVDVARRPARRLRPGRWPLR